MAFQLSPGVLVVEKDLTNVIPAVSTSVGAFCGTFYWGPVEEIVTVGSEAELVKRFGKPITALTATSFLTAASFLSYANNLKVVRAVGSTAKNAVVSGTAILIKNRADWEQNYINGAAAVGEFAAKYPGTLGNSIKVSMADSATFAAWAYKDEFDSAPGTSAYTAAKGGSGDELHLVVVDAVGEWTGTSGTILEKFAFLSKASDGRSSDGANRFYKTVLANESEYIWWMDYPTGLANWGTTAAGTTFAVLTGQYDQTLIGGVNANDITTADLEEGFDLFANPEAVDFSLIFVGEAPLVTAKYVVENIAMVRKDCVAFVSPAGVSVVNNPGSELTDIAADKTTLGLDTSYAFMDSGWKYMFDKYNDVYRWVPLNGDMAGLCARTDSVADAWFSPGGLNRGQVKNVVRLAWSPTKTQQDELYKTGVNPVITLTGSGTVLWGDKTMQSKPSAFDRINVRRLFIVLEKAIAIAAKYELFEFNDAFTRAQFRSMVEPFLRDIQGRRGIFDFRVVCDTTNNTAQVIDTNSFVADIYIKPARSINFITLNFVAVRTGVKFEEIVGQA